MVSDSYTCPLLPSDCGEVVNNFAYGSNMSLSVLTGRRKITPIKSTAAVLHGYALTFNLRGVPYLEPGFGNLVPHKGSAVHGVVHSMRKADFVRLLQSEAGNGNSRDGYIPVPVQLTAYDGTLIDAYALQVDSTSPLISTVNVLPSKRYMDLLMAGAKQFNMRESYQRFLADVPVFSPTPTQRGCAIAFTLLVIIIMSPVLIPLVGFSWIKDGRAIAMSQLYHPLSVVLWRIHTMATWLTGHVEGEYIIRPYRDDIDETNGASDDDDGIIALD